MVLNPKSREELAESLALASQAGSRVTRVNLEHIASVTEHKPEDMTATVQAGATLADLQSSLRNVGQWLPLDPHGEGALTIGDLVAYNSSGPRRFGYGTVRDYVIGMHIAMADGTIIKAGGKVVKNVAGYDLCKLFVGAQHSLGIVVETTFKLRPIPETEKIFESSFASRPLLHAAARAVLDSEIEPVILDAHNLGRDFTLVVGLSGASEDVAWQAERLAHRAGGSWREGNTKYDRDFHAAGGDWQTMSVLPSRLSESLGLLTDVPFVARYGNGIVYHRGNPVIQGTVTNHELMSRLKTAYDPQSIFPEFSL